MSELNIQAALAKWEAERKARAKTLKRDKATLNNALKGLDVAYVEAEYDGEGDSGLINTITATKADNSNVDLVAVAPCAVGVRSYSSLHEFIDEFVWDLLECHHDGFEINDGGFGKVVIDTARGIARIEHNAWFSDSEYSETEV